MPTTKKSLATGLLIGFTYLIVLLLSPTSLKAQYLFSGKVSEESNGKNIYLSLVEDYRKSSRIYRDQIIRKAVVDSLGNFRFTGNNILKDNRVYRIHIDNCEESLDGNHFFGQCDLSSSVLFIANNKDTIQFPTSFEDQVLCTIVSTNEKSSIFLEIDALKEEMIFDFMDFGSETNKRLNSENWFQTLQEFGQGLQEPLGELYIYDFLSDKKNETYEFYLKDILSNPYYSNLLNRLEITYPNTSFENQYRAEIETDNILASYNEPKSWDWKWIILLLLLFSLGLNGYFFISNRFKKNNSRKILLQKLTPQEQKIVQHILQDKSNKEIAADLFVSHSTVKTHINNLYKKMEVSSREEIVGIFKN